MVTWNKKQIARFKKLYPVKELPELMQTFGATKSAIKNAQSKFKVYKAPNYTGSRGYYPKGNQPFNKGKRMVDYIKDKATLQRIQSTQFKKGQQPHNTKHNGAERVTQDGYVEVRIRLGVYMLKHRRLWILKNGPLKHGEIIKFKDGNKLNVSIENLYKTTMRENMADNTIQRYPPELREVMRLTNKLTKTINNN